MAFWIGLIISASVVIGLAVFWAYIALASMKDWYF